MIGGIFLLGSTLLIYFHEKVLTTYPIDIYKSDIIPTIQVCVNRFLAGEPVYTPIDEFHYDHFPNYMPLKWLPFVIAEWFGFEYRWIPLVIGLIGIGFYQVNLLKQNHHLVLAILLAVAPFLLLLYYYLNMPWNMAYTVELMDLGFHLVMFVAILNGGFLFRGISIVIVLLSRYSIVLWLPVFFLGLFFKENKMKTVKTALVVFIGIAGLYIIPFLSTDWTSFSQGQQAYLLAAQGSWNVSQQDQEKGEIVPHVMRDQIGIASYFYLFVEGEKLEKINALKKTHIAVSVFTVLLIGFIFWKWGSSLPPGYYFLYSLKIYLAIFYAFIQVPFFYLFITPLFLSLFIVQVKDGGG
ncbi:MAG: hypothetical protein KDD99_06780 [Bacteroidetes bacterium]|nr:hypothetical protein [Bacteroidota bacterium]